MKKSCLSLFTAALLGLPALGGPVRADEAPTGVEVQARGPVHEAYAEPTDVRPTPTVVVNRKPPDPIPELPPDQKPADENVLWIPGYWAWADDASDFLWISGFWRVPPPGRQWVPGYWQQVEEGWQWVPGYWTVPEQTQVTYLPPPPPSVDAGASTPAPDDTSTYVPGCWVYREARYYWRPGYWVAYYAGWVWVPSHYIWTPGGYVFVDGYWDRPLALRGLLFAPVRIDRRIIVAGWYYTPQYIVRPDFLLSAFFVRPNYCHYYFGDYFGDSYDKRGFVPWVDYRVGRHAYDPNFAYYRATFASDPSWERNLRHLYTARRDGEIARPPHTWSQQSQAVQSLTVNKTENSSVHKNFSFTNLQNVTALAPLSQAHNTRITNLSALAPKVEAKNVPVLKLAAVSKQEQTQVQKHAEQVRQLGHERSQVESHLLSQGKVPTKPTDAPNVGKLTLPKLPVTTKPTVKAPEPPPAPKAPTHVEKAIPPHEPIKPVRPPKVEPKPEIKPPTPTPKPEPKPEVKPPAPKPEVKPPVPQPKPEPKPEVKPPAPRPEVKPPTPAPAPPAPKPEVKPPAPRPEVKPPTPAPAPPTPKPSKP